MVVVRRRGSGDRRASPGWQRGRGGLVAGLFEMHFDIRPRAEPRWVVERGDNLGDPFVGQHLKFAGRKQVGSFLIPEIHQLYLWVTLGSSGKQAASAVTELQQVPASSRGGNGSNTRQQQQHK